jgi:hypothetical protein
MEQSNKVHDINESSNLQHDNDSNSPNKHNMTGFKDSSKQVESLQSINFKIIFYLLLVMLNTLLIYIIKPICVILELIFLTTIVNVKPNEFQITESELLSMGMKAIGWIIIFLIPLYHFFTLGLKIISIQRHFFGKLYIGIFNLIEILFNIPLTFCYSSNLYSVFLYEEKGVKQLLSPWLVFFPSEYILSVYEILRNFIEPGFFFALGFMKFNEIKNNEYQAYQIVILQLMIALCVLRFMGNIFNLVIKIRSGLASKKMKK